MWRGLKDREWLRSIPGRFGGLPFPVTGAGGIWLHAVSVGEVLSASAVLGTLRERLPDTPLYVSVSTTTGHTLALQKLSQDCDGVFYTPLDYCFAVRRVLRALQPSLVLVLETEIWPNLWRETKRFGAGLLVVNARISDRAYPKYRRFEWFFRPVLRIPDTIYAQSEQDLERYRSLGAPPARLYLGRNLKYDFDPGKIQTHPEIASWVRELRPQKVVVAASTMPGIDDQDGDEDDWALDAFTEVSAPGLLWIHVPRRPARFDLAADKMTARGIRFVRRSALQTLELPGILLLDTLGELGGVFRLADVVFMGGTLVRRGGHNILEPAFFGKPIVAGPHMENFAEIAAEFTAAGALRRIAGPEELATALRELISAPGEIGAKAKVLAESKRGAARIAATAAMDVIESNWPKRVPSVAARVFLAPLSRIWDWAGRRSRRRGARAAARLPVPVVCVGGLAMGGTGKTPAVLHLAQQFAGAGRLPGILTRGYRRLTPEPMTLVAKGESIAVSETGDEAQILIRAGLGPVGIGADRAATGRALLEQWPAEVLVLDDGYQHRKLHRDFDLLLLDAQDPLTGGVVFPLGRMREDPARGLARAHAVLLTRTQRGREYTRLRRFIEQHRPSMPVFTSRVAPGEWLPGPLPEGPAGAFCGLGNPASFWMTLRRMGVAPRFRWTFGDHHLYRPQELQRLRVQALDAGVAVLLTTEKDRMNLPDNAEAFFEPVALRWLEIRLEIDDEAGLTALLNLATGRSSG